MKQGDWRQRHGLVVLTESAVVTELLFSVQHNALSEGTDHRKRVQVVKETTVLLVTLSLETTVGEERMAEHHVGTDPLATLVPEAIVQEADAVLRELQIARDLVRAVVQVSAQVTQMSTIEWSVASEQLVSQRAQTPNVHLVVVILAVHHLRSHEQWRACKRLPEVQGGLHRLCKTHVTELELVVGDDGLSTWDTLHTCHEVDEDVVKFDVSMDYVL